MTASDVALPALGLAVVLLSVAMWLVRRRVNGLQRELRRHIHELEAAKSAARGRGEAPLNAIRPARRTPTERDTLVTRNDVAPPAAPHGGPAGQNGPDDREPAPNPRQPMEPADRAAVSEPVYSVALVEELYANWCRDKQRPRPTAAVDVGHLRHAGRKESQDFGGPMMHRLADSDAAAEFVRFSAPAKIDGLVYPNPDAHFSPVMNYLFPDLTRAAYDNPEVLLAVKCVSVRKAGDGYWEAI